MRVAIIADSHFDEHSRFEECIRVHDWIATDLRERRVDAVLHAGDVFERRSTAHERSAVADWLTRVAEHAPVVVVRGNHDAVGDLSIFRRLRTRHSIHIEEEAGMARLEVAHHGLPTSLAVGCIAWPRKAELRTWIEAQRGAPVSVTESEHAASELLRDILRGLGAQLDRVRPGPRVLLAHAMVRGSKTSTGQPLVGCDMELGIEDLWLAGAHFVAIGHVHKGQDWTWGGAPIVYPGSPRRTAFGEIEPKGYLVVDFELEDHGWMATWERVETPCTRMVLIEDTWRGELGFHGGPLQHYDGPVGPAEIRFRYTCSVDQRDAARVGAREWADVWRGLGATVRVEEEVTATTRSRSPEIATAKTLGEQLAAMWAARRVELSDERRGRLLSRVNELEAA